VITSFSVPINDAWILDELDRLAKLERKSFSEMVRIAIKEYIERHRKGNPQTTLVPPPQIYFNPVLEHKATLIDDLEKTIKHNFARRVPLKNIVAAFAASSGLNEETVWKYVTLLRRAGRIKNAHLRHMWDKEG